MGEVGNYLGDLTDLGDDAESTAEPCASHVFARSYLCRYGRYVGKDPWHEQDWVPVVDRNR
jgi:hypothetical protein